MHYDISNRIYSISTLQYLQQNTLDYLHNKYDMYNSKIRYVQQ